MNIGLCSISFRSLSVDEIIDLVKKAGLNTVEWGSDVHAPVGNLDAARSVARRTAQAGLSIVSYGSYYRCDPKEDFTPYAETADVLGAKIIRIWASEKDAETFSDAEYAELVQSVQRAAAIAAKYGQTLAFEHHFGTYCNNAANTLRLLQDVGRDNVKTYWQPAYWSGADSRETDLDTIRQFQDRIVGVHVYKWSGFQRFALEEGRADWQAYADLIRGNRYYLEFAKGDSTEQLLEDARVLHDVLARYLTEQ